MEVCKAAHESKTRLFYWRQSNIFVVSPHSTRPMGSLSCGEPVEARCGEPVEPWQAVQEWLERLKGVES